MSNAVQFSTPGKNILQQTNSNVPPPVELKCTEKEKDVIQRRKKRTLQETENRLEEAKSVVSKLRRVRLDVSSHKLGAGYHRMGSYHTSSDETGGDEEEEEEEAEDEEVAEICRGGRKTLPRPIIPNYVTKSDKGQYRKRRKSRSDTAELSSQREGKTQASISIAKRNARERNRVKLVNQGFATLRSRIPDYISEMYKEEKKKKKVSKVETLRMALGYIRHLSDMLELRSAEPSQWFRMKTDDLWKSTSNSSTGYPSPVDTDYQRSPTNGAYTTRDAAFYEYDLELETVKDLSAKEDSHLGEDKDTLLLPESSFSVSIGCCYDVDKPETQTPEESEPKKSPLPSITESFPKKNLRAFYETPPFLSGSSAFHV